MIRMSERMLKSFAACLGSLVDISCQGGNSACRAIRTPPLDDDMKVIGDDFQKVVNLKKPL